MYILYDHITATILSGTVFLVLLAMQMNVMQLNLQETSHYMTKQYALDFADWMEDDILRLGKNVDRNSTNPIRTLTTSGSNTTEFVFLRDSINSANPSDTVRVATKYELEETEKRTIDGTQVQLYEVQRHLRLEDTDGTPRTSYALTGKSAGLVRYFEITTLNRDGAPEPYTNPKKVRQTRIRFAMATPFESQNNALRTIQWGATLLTRN